jgi:hypothetical protein
MTGALAADRRSCQTCAHFEPNGTRYGGYCCNPNSSWYCAIVSCLKDDESVQTCHSNYVERGDD